MSVSIPPGYRYPVDTEHVHRAGRPGDGHPRRCQGTRRKEQCKYWASVGSLYCKFHGARLNRNQPRRFVNMRYKTSPTLADAIKELKATDQNDVSDEIALIRTHAERVVKIYDATVVNPESTASPDLKDKAASALRKSMFDVIAVVEKAAKINALIQSLGSAKNIDYVLARIAAIIQRELADVNPEACARIFKDINAIKLETGTVPTVTINV